MRRKKMRDKNFFILILTDLLRDFYDCSITFDLHVVKIIGIRFDPLILRLWAELLSQNEKEDLSWRKVKTG